MKIKLIKHWRHHRPDTVLEVPDGVAEIMISRHQARQVKTRGRSHRPQDKMMHIQKQIDESTKEPVHTK